MNAVRKRRRAPEPPPALRAERTALAAAALGPLLLYALTMPRTVVLEDDGLFLAAAASLGVAHPPGYPLYTLICHLFMQLPFGTPAALGHLSSAVLGALACGAVWRCARMLGAGPWPALAAAWLFGASEHVWSQAIIAEVYTLNALLFFAVLALLMRASQGGEERGAERALCAAAALYGLSIANHWPLTVLSTPALALAAWPARRLLLRLRLLPPALFLAAAALPYGWMAWRSFSGAFFNFYGPFDSLRQFWFFVSRQGYAHVDSNPAAGLEDKLQFLQWLAGELARQPTLAGFLLALLGLAALLRARRLAAAGAGLLALAGNGPALALLLGFDYDSFSVAVFRPYSLACYGVLALWAAVGLQWLADRAARVPALRRGRPFAAAAAAAAMAAASVEAHWAANDRSGAVFSEHYAEAVLDSMPQGAILFVNDDIDAGLLGYYRFVEGRRPDVTLVSTIGIAFEPRAVNWRWPAERRRKALRAFVEKAGTRAFFLSRSTPRDLGIGARLHGFVTEGLPDKPAHAQDLTFHDGFYAYFRDLLAWRPADRWERRLRNGRLYEYGLYLGFWTLAGKPAPPERLAAAVAAAEQDYFSLTAMAGVLLKHGGPEHYPQIAAWLEKAGPIAVSALENPKSASALPYMKGIFKRHRGAHEEARPLFEESRRIHPHPENPAFQALRELDRRRDAGGPASD